MENHQNALPTSSILSTVPSPSPPSLSTLFLPVFQEKCHIGQNTITDRMKSINHYKPITISLDDCNHGEKGKIGISHSCDLNILDNRDDYSLTDDHFKIDLSSCEEEKSVEGLLQSINVSDLSLFSNDFLFEDCNSLDQASQLVDSALKDFESTPINFNININNNNNNELVQLIKSDFKIKEYINLNENNDNLCEDNNKMVQNDKLPLIQNEKDAKEDNQNQCEIHETVHGLNVHVQHQCSKKSIYKEPISRVRKEKKGYGLGPIKRGRRYLPNFKEKVLEYTKNHTYKETATHFQINSNTITEWSREKREMGPAVNEKTNKSEEPRYEYKNHKTDKLGTPESKTEFILYNDDTRLETDYNEPSLESNKKDLNASSPPSPSSSGTSLSPFDMKPDENFLKWIKKRRLERKELTRQEVFQMGKHCLKRWSGNLEPSSWFVLWLNRFNRVLNSVNSNVETEKYIKYPSSFKLEVVLYARLFSKNSAARVFNVSRKRTFDWYGRLASLDKAKSFDVISVNLNARSEEEEEEEEYTELDKMKFSPKKDETKDKIYSELHLWYQKMFYNGTRPTSNEIKDKAREIFSFYGMKEIKFSDGWLQKFCRRTNIKLRHCEDDELLFWVLTQFDNNVSLSHQDITEKSSLLIGRKQFKGSKGWTLRFLKRHRNLLQHFPSFPVQLPRVAQEKSTLFWDNFRQNLVSFCVEPENIGSMDEIPLNFNYPEESNSANAPLLRKTGFENCQGIVFLSSMANGKLLPPAVVFKGTQPKQLFSGQSVDIIVLYEEKGLITVDILEIWMREIWLRWAPKPSALVVDSFEPHRSKGLEQMLAKNDCLLHVIPEGCSSRFQPLDIEVTPSFKEEIKNQWKEFLAASDGVALKTSRKCRCPDQETILPWIEKAYEKMNGNSVSITNSFKKTGLLQSKT